MVIKCRIYAKKGEILYYKLLSYERKSPLGVPMYAVGRVCYVGFASFTN